MVSTKIRTLFLVLLLASALILLNEHQKKEVSRLEKRLEKIEIEIRVNEAISRAKMDNLLAKINELEKKVKEETKGKQLGQKVSRFSQARTGSKVSRGTWRTCLASTYGIGDGLVGQVMANGRRLTLDFPSIAVRPSYRKRFGLKLGDWILIRYKGREVKARIDDSGPYVGERMIDLGPLVSKKLGFEGVHYIYWREEK